MNRIILDDCLSYAKNIPENYFDLIIADPPYFKICGEFDFVWHDVSEYIQWCQEWCTEFTRTLKPTGSFYLWGAIGYGTGFPLFKIVDYLESNKILHVVNWITQRNSRGFGTKKGYMASREELVFMVKSKDYYWNTCYLEEKSKRKDFGFDGKQRKNTHKRCSDVWVDIAEASQSSIERKSARNFPTVKAQKLTERILKASSREGDLVFIPFGGSGSEAEC